MLYQKLYYYIQSCANIFLLAVENLFVCLFYCQRDCTKHTDRIFKKQCVQIDASPVNFGKDPDKGEQICTCIKKVDNTPLKRASLHLNTI